MPETTPLIKAALNLRVGAGFDVYFRTKGQAGYVYYEYSREYDPSKQYTNVKRVTIGKALLDDRNKMRPNENFRKYFPEVDKRKPEAGFSGSVECGQM